MDLFEEGRAYKAELLGKMFGVPAQSADGSKEAARSSVIPSSSNVLGVGYGMKSVESSLSQGEAAVRVYVRAKLPRGQIVNQELVPSEVNGRPTDVVPVGEIIAHRGHTVPCGVSVGHHGISAGTLGCLVEKEDTQDVFILSNNHVLANSNSASSGDAIHQPGPSDGPTVPPDDITDLEDFEPLDFAGGVNTIDGAIAKLRDPGDVTADVLAIGTISSSTMPASLYQSVRKTGRTTHHTVGVIDDLGADITVRYGSQRADFEDQLGIRGVQGSFSQGGDSGSLVVDAVSLRPVGLLFAGGGSQTFANRIDDVLGRFGVSVRV